MGTSGEDQQHNSRMIQQESSRMTYLSLMDALQIRRFVLAFLVSLWTLASLPVHGQGIFPSRPVRLVVPAPAGGLTDTVGRLLADAMQVDLGQPIVVENRSGAAGLIGTQTVLEAPADGYTVLLTSTSNHILAPLTQISTRVNPPHDLQPVGLALRTVGVLVTSVNVTASTLSQFIAQARSRPGQLNYASSGIGSANHVMTERFKTLAGIDIVHIPYRGGAPLMTALMAGEVQFALIDLATVETAWRSGKAKVLAQSGLHRHSALPDVQTLVEAGFKDFDPSFWIGLAVPRSTPLAVVERLNVSLNKALTQTNIKARAQAMGWTLIGGSPRVLAETVERDMAAYRDTVSGLKIDRQ